MLSLIRPAIVLLITMTLITGVAYPLLVTGLAMTLFPNQSSGSLIDIGSGREASELIGQSFTSDRYFWSRPSATGPFPYNPEAGSGSNLGPSSGGLQEAVRGRVTALRDAHPEKADTPVPADLVTASASGLDPHISVEAAEYQIERVAKARGLEVASVRAAIKSHIEPRTLGVLGEDRVNVLRLNLALDGNEPARQDAGHGVDAGSRWPMSTY